MTDRASLFETSLDSDLSDFAPNLPRPPEQNPPVEAVRAISQAANFPSREAIPPPPSPPAPLSVTTDPRPELPRHRTGRNVQLNLKVTTETVVRFYNIAKSKGWVLGETLEHAVEALEQSLQLQK
jgi:hypothetical protein